MERWRWRGGETERKERNKANGFMATVIIRLAENHFISHRAEETLGNGMEQVFIAVFRGCDADAPLSVCACISLHMYARVCLLWPSLRWIVRDSVCQKTSLENIYLHTMIL